MKYSIICDDLFKDCIHWEVKKVGMKNKDDEIIMKIYDKDLLQDIRNFLKSKGYKESTLSKNRENNK